jgi:hypothetical protein
VHATILMGEATEVVERFFRFEAGGNLAPIDAPREPPILSDSLLSEMRANGGISSEEFDRATLIDATLRYQIVKFGDYLRNKVSNAYDDITKDPGFRDFLLDLQSRSTRQSRA